MASSRQYRPSACGYSQLDQLVADRIPRQGRRRGVVELLFHLLPVGVHGLDADVEHLGHCLVVVAFGYQLNNLALTRALIAAIK